jgi:hypothetical protein
MFITTAHLLLLYQHILYTEYQKRKEGRKEWKKGGKEGGRKEGRLLLYISFSNLILKI